MAGWLYWAHVGGSASAAVVALWLALRIRRGFDHPAAGWMWRLLVVLGLWGGAVTLQLLVPSLAVKVAMVKAGTVLGWASLVLWFLFVLEFTGRGHVLTRPVRVGVAGVFALIAALVATNPIHELLWTDFRLVEEGFSHVAATETGLQLAIFGTLAALALVGFALVVRTLLTSRQASRRQLVTILAGFLLAAPSALIEFTGLAPAPHFEYGPLISMAFFIAVTYGIVRHDLFAVAPFARDAVLESLEEGVVVLDGNGRIADYNESAVEILPAIEGAFGVSFASVAPESMVADGGPEAVPGGIADEIEIAVDGDRYVYSVDVSPLAQRGRTRGYAVLLRDQTELEEYATKLERQTERLDQFASLVSHDLRNPLSVARGRLELARRDGDPDAFEGVEDALERMDEIIDDALALSRARAENAPDESVSLREVARAAWEQTDAKDATFEEDIPEDDVFVLADRERLKTLFENLYRNATDHGPDDVTVRVSATEEGFAVEDTGPGIPSDRHEKVFDRGFTTSDETTGLGLSIVADIVDAYGWEIAITEGVEGGARFEIATVARPTDEDVDAPENS